MPEQKPMSSLYITKGNTTYDLEMKDSVARAAITDATPLVFGAGLSKTTESGTTTITAPEMTGATASTAGTSGLVPAPAAGDQGSFLKGDGTWATIEIGEQKVHVLNKTTGLTTTEFEQAWEWLENGHLVGAWYNDSDFKYLFIADKYYTYWSSQTEYFIIFSYIRYVTPLETQYDGVNRDTLTWMKSRVGNMTWGTKPIMPSPINQFGRYLYTNGQDGAPYWKEIKEVPASIASDAGKVLTVNAQGSATWSTVTPYAPAPSANNVLLLGDATGGKTWTALENDVFGTQLLDENDQPILDETTQEPIYDAYSTDQLWTGFAGKKFGAARAVADQDGNVFGETYARKLLPATKAFAASVTVDNNRVTSITGVTGSVAIDITVAPGECANTAVELTTGSSVTADSAVTVTVNGVAAGRAAATDGKISASKKYQVTCVGTCWTMAEFETANA